MPRWLHIIVQVIVQGAGAYATYKTGTPLPTVLAGSLSGVVGVVQQAYTINGTPESQTAPPPIKLKSVVMGE